MTHLDQYLKALADVRASGEATDETSYYTALDNLLDAIGGDLKPKVRCILTLKNRGAGHPDGGLFTQEQFQKLSDVEPLPGTKPSRGAIEVKPTSDDAWVVAQSDQVTKYWKEYGQVLVTNYRDFVLVGRDAEGRPVKLASYRLAPDEKSFWKLAVKRGKDAQAQADRFADFLKLVTLSPAVLVSPKDVAWVLAYYAREAKSRVEAHTALPALSNVREALEQALGLKFEGEKGERFFRSALVQTLFYGVFSAWVLWCKENSPTSKATFEWRLAVWSLRVRMVRALFEQVATPGTLGPLRLMEVLEWTASALNRVDRAEFFKQFQEQEAVLYFYEPFLEAFDPELRKELGVWYTPLEVVKYMVARADRVLRDELGLEDGLADPNVYVLDPGCGTGAYLVETLRRIGATLKQKGADALTAHAVKQAAMQRVFGFEILPAPFVISHLQLGLVLQDIGAPLADDGSERAAVFLTNSLTGWEPPKGPKQHLMFPEMEEERDRAEHVKREARILVVIGNPPYNAFAGVSPAEEERLVEPYKEGLISEWKIKKFNLDDLYVRFFRLAERRIAENTGRGVVAYISNFSYLGDPSFVVMRQRFLNEFDKLWFDCMNGDSRETGKLTPDGKPDPSVFSTPSNPEGIRVGTAVAVMVRRPDRQQPEVRFRHFWGTTKRQELLDSLKAPAFDDQYELVHPDPAHRYSFRPGHATAEYMAWPRVTELCAVPPMNGLMEKRDGALIDVDRRALAERMQAYFDLDLDWSKYKALGYGLMEDQARFDAKKTREKVLKTEQFQENRLVRYSLRPFEARWAYYTGIRPVWNEPRPNLWQQLWGGNAFLVTRPAGVASPEGIPFYFTTLLGDNDALRGHAYYVPISLRLLEAKKAGDLFQDGSQPKERQVVNLSRPAKDYMEELGLAADQEPAALWHHVLAIGYSPAYLTEHADGIRTDWPRVPLPSTREALLNSVQLGRQLAALLNKEDAVTGVTAGAIREELRVLGTMATVEGHTFSGADDLFIDAGWGHGGKDGATMPGKGKVIEREYTTEERSAVEAGAAALGLVTEEAFAALGEKTCDVFLNGRAYWRNVPIKVWEFYIGGYQVIKKWLSYREGKLLGRPLTIEEASYVRDVVRRLAAICLLQPQLDANSEAIAADAYAWETALSPVHSSGERT